MNESIAIIGAGLSGCEAALQLADNGKQVIIFEQKPVNITGAYNLETFAELVCNNSLGPRDVNRPLGLLLSELEIMGSKLINIAMDSTVRDSRYLSINKKTFSEKVSKAIINNPRITVINKTVSYLPNNDIVVIASGPMTNEELLNQISAKYNVIKYHFSDSSCAIVDINSIDLKNKYIERISDDLYSVFIPPTIFKAFSDKLAKYYSNRDRNKAHNFIECQAIEMLASQGDRVLRDKRFSHQGFLPSTLLLRREGALEDGFILVGCMTTLRHPEQLDAFSLLPGFSKLRMIKYGRMHQNTFFHGPGILNSFYQVNNTNTYIIGQLSGIDGYAPAISSGFVAAQKILHGENFPMFPTETMIGSLANYVSNTNVVDFQPMCASFSLIKSLSDCSKTDSALAAIKQYKELVEGSKII